MPRDMILATSYSDAWGTAQIKPSPYVEGLGSWAQQIADDEAYLAYQNMDNAVVYRFDPDQAVDDSSTFIKYESWFVYYAGYAPSAHFMVTCLREGLLQPWPIAISLTMGDVGLATVIINSFTNATNAIFDVAIPDTISAGEHEVSLYAKAESAGASLRYISVAFMPT